MDSAPFNVIGSVRVSTTEQEISLEVQEAAIRAECARRGWNLVRIAVDRCSGRTPIAERPGLASVFGELRAGMVDVLMVYKVDRLSRSVADFAGTLARTQTEGWQLVALDLGVDTTTPNGRFMAQVMAAFAELERELISTRTKEALAAKRAQGIHTGRRSTLPDAVVERIVDLRRSGETLPAIADLLNRDGVPTGQGAPAWTKHGVRCVLRTIRAQRAMDGVRLVTDHS